MNRCSGGRTGNGIKFHEGPITIRKSQRDGGRTAKNCCFTKRLDLKHAMHIQRSAFLSGRGVFLSDVVFLKKHTCLDIYSISLF
jgi:hypothetical protein